MNYSSQLRRSKRLQLEQRSSDVFQISELIYEILCHCSWTTLVNLTKVNIHFRDWVYCLIRHRITTILNRFIDDITNLFCILKETNGVIIGSVVWSIMTEDSINPQDLNFAVPRTTTYTFERLKAYLCTAGTSVIYDGPPAERFKPCIERYTILKNKEVRNTFYFVDLPFIN
jgi:hypothetical protein